MIPRGSGSPAAAKTAERTERLWPLFARRLGLLLGLLALMYWAQASERVQVVLHVVDGRCTAVLYGRSSTIDCAALAGGASVTPVRLPFDLLNTAEESPLLLRPAWRNVRVTGPGGQPLVSEDAGRQPAFDVYADLFSPNARAGLVLSEPDSRIFDAGDDATWSPAAWVFVVDAANRRGEWWQWHWDSPLQVRGGLSVPLRGIPLDRPVVEQAKPLLNALLATGGLALVWALLLMRKQLTAGSTPDHQTGPARRPGRWSPLLAPLASSAAGRALRYAVLVPCLAAFAVALHVSVDILERIPHIQDSVTYLF